MNFNGMYNSWEYGSDFHWLDFKPLHNLDNHPWSNLSSVKFGSGRDAFRSLLIHGVEFFGWKRMFLPTFFCQDVIAAMRMPEIELKLYADAVEEPVRLPDNIGPGDAVLLVNFFGLRKPVEISALRESGAFVVEDHSHDPWSPWAWSSEADYCVVALRKTLPVPEGGVLWSPVGRMLPTEPASTIEREQAAETKRAGMILKRLYLEGHAVEKESFRQLLIEGENQIASGMISGMTKATKAMLDCLPVNRWRTQRMENFSFLAREIKKIESLYVFCPEESGCAPFNVTVLTETHRQREHLRLALIKRQIYPAILWSLDNQELQGIPVRHIELSKRVLSLHCDARYNLNDVKRVVSNLSDILKTES